MNLVQRICNTIVCPPKFKYSIFDLGNCIMKHCHRKDYAVRNKNDQRIMMSYYQPLHNQNGLCLIYLHSMNGSRLQSVPYIQKITEEGYGFCCFDFSGCGNSDGQFCTFGANQKHDVVPVIKAIKQKYQVSSFVLWGRSMGAVCAIKYCQMVANMTGNDPSIQIQAMILDSPFYSFQKLAIEFANNNSSIPQLFIKGFHLIKSSLEKRGEFIIEDLELLESINCFQIPVLFFTSKIDTIVGSHHVKKLYDSYRFPLKELYYIEEGHNESRNSSYLSKIISYLAQMRRILQDPKSKDKFRKKRIEQESIIKTLEQQDLSMCSCVFFNNQLHPSEPVAPRPEYRQGGQK